MILKKILASVTLITMAALYIHAQDTAEEQFLKDSLTAFASEDEDAVPETTQFLHSIKYKVNSLSYETSGRTKPYALERNISTLPESHIFPNEREFTSYLEKIRLQIMNTRMFATVTFVFTTKEENGIALADVVFKTKDSHNVLVLPKPSLDSNSGIEVKFKLKDNNFLGLMNTLNIDFNGRLGNEDTPDDWSKVTFGINFSYDYPFSYWITNDVWSNSFTFDWEIGEDKPEFSVKTGLTIGFPVGQHELDLTFEQGMKRDASYIDFGDELYFTESATLSMPFVLGHIEDTTPVKYTPFVSLSYIWDMDGIDELNTDLIRTPVASIGQTFGFSRINWDKVNNFRNGWYFSTTQQFAVNFHDDTLKERFMPSISGKAKYFLGFKYVGFEAAATFFTGYNTTTNIGSSVRGALDKQKYTNFEIDANNNALETHTAAVFNFSMPVHIITTHWLDWSYALFGAYDTKPLPVKILAGLPHFLFKYTDFEMQWAPFVDVALIENRSTGNVFFYKEGIYTCGLEVLVYPSKWKSFVVRGSLGIDVSKKVLDGHKGFDSSWRKPSKNWEAYFGLGTHL